MRRSTEALIGAGAVALQGPFLAYLSRQPAWGTLLLTASFLVPAAAVNRSVSRRAAPAGPDLSFCLCLGTLGMLAGWFADAGFRPLVGAGVCLCGCADSMTGFGLLTSFHWMQGLMLASCAAGAAASEGLSSLLSPGSSLRLLCTSLCMLAGMAVAGWCEGGLRILNPSLGLVFSYLAMALGMAAGSVIGERLSGVLFRARAPGVRLSAQHGAGATP
ncbi:MAG TPA: hypothetical protein VFE25_09130 [Opitutaceae bacterium]|jgi:hypothetical protein|nr:hypothetical protein [Opitutaceae bacterium]